MENFCRLNKFIYPCNAQTTIFIIQLCVAVELFSFEDACGFIAETASFYITEESGGSMCRVIL